MTSPANQRCDCAVFRTLGSCRHIRRQAAEEAAPGAVEAGEVAPAQVIACRAADIGLAPARVYVPNELPETLPDLPETDCMGCGRALGIAQRRSGLCLWCGAARNGHRLADLAAPELESEPGHDALPGHMCQGGCGYAAGPAYMPPPGDGMCIPCRIRKTGEIPAGYGLSSGTAVVS